MWPVPVLVRGVLGQDGRQVAFAEDEHPVGAFSACGAGPAFSERVRPGACGGVLITSVPAAVNTASNPAVNLVSRSRSSNRNPAAR
jgi:hypothetical protein